tara:strand:+ start:398 stop:514 length:117 start_codon:yes stop_codon:yes gene_type:complete
MRRLQESVGVLRGVMIVHRVSLETMKIRESKFRQSALV